MMTVLHDKHLTALGAALLLALAAALPTAGQAERVAETDAGYNEPDPDPDPGGSAGNVRFVTASMSRSEGGGSFDVGVERVSGSNGAVSVSYQTSDGSAAAGSDYSHTAGTLAWAVGEGGVKTFQVAIFDDGTDEPDETINVALSNPTGGVALSTPSNATLTIQDDDASAPQTGRVEFETSQYSVGEWAGKATVTVRRTGGSAGAISVDYATADASAYDGADYTAASGTLSWANGQSGTRSFEVAILDDDEEESSETVNLSLSNPTGSAAMGRSSATLEIADDDSSDECVETETTMCLRSDSRFRITVQWRDFEDNTGAGRVFDFAPVDSGLFWFFGPDNAEILVKTLDGCPINGHYWFFTAATTNVEYTIMVTDTQSGLSKTYSNPLGERAAAVTDTTAFATCP